jgi:transglutaminase-like putative cysteine protease
MRKPHNKGMLWVSATLAVAMVPQLQRMPVAVAVMSLAPLLWRFARDTYGWKPLRPMLRYGATALSLIALVSAYGGLFGRRASVSLLAAMLALKLLECERIRDGRMVVSFSFFLCATQFLFDQSIVMPFYGGATLIIGLVALTHLQRQEAFAHAGPPPAVRAPLLAELGFSLRLLGLALPICLAFFLLFPRWGAPLWGVPETTLDAKTGLSDSMSPGSIENLFMDDSPAFRVEFEGRVPQQSELYWRGPVFWHYDGNTWSSSFYGRNIEAPLRPREAGAPWHYRVQLEPNERHWLFALDYPVIAPPETRITMDFQLLRRQPVIQLMQYAMVSNPEFTDAPELAATLRSIALELPDGLNPRTRELVGRWQRESSGSSGLIRRVFQHFNEQPFHYSLNAPRLGRHAVDEFLFETRTGYCEHYASAFAVMMRMAGIPSRIVTGYQGGWFSGIGDYLLIRQSDAHAWVELWLPGSGWTRFDPTAAVSPTRVERGSLDALSDPRHLLDFNWVRNVRNSVDLVNQRWNNWVIEFGAQQQARLFAGLGLDYMRPGTLVSVLFGLVLLLSAILLPLILRTRGPGSKDPLQQLWQRFVRRLRKAGCAYQPSQGALELAANASVRLPEEATRIFRIAQLYNRYRYAPQPPELDEIRSAVREFRPKKRG